MDTVSEWYENAHTSVERGPFPRALFLLFSFGLSVVLESHCAATEKLSHDVYSVSEFSQ